MWNAGTPSEVPDGFKGGYSVCMNIYIHTYIYMYVCIYVHIDILEYVYIYIYMCDVHYRFGFWSSEVAFVGRVTNLMRAPYWR